MSHFHDDQLGVDVCLNEFLLLVIQGLMFIHHFRNSEIIIEVEKHTSYICAKASS